MMKVHARALLNSALATVIAMTCSLVLLVAGCGSVPPGATFPGPPSVNITANATSITAGASSTLTVTSSGTPAVVISGTDGSVYDMEPPHGTLSVKSAVTTTYTAKTYPGDLPSIATVTVTVTPR